MMGIGAGIIYHQYTILGFYLRAVNPDFDYPKFVQITCCILCGQWIRLREVHGFESMVTPVFATLVLGTQILPPHDWVISLLPKLKSTITLRN